MNAMSRLTGTVLGGYRLGGTLDRGAEATTYRARHETDGTEVSVKVLALDTNDGPQDILRWEREAVRAAEIDHPNVGRILASGREQGLLWTATEWVDGDSLRQRQQRDGRLSVADTIAAGRQVLAALVAAHEKGVLHRDITADCILQDRDGTIRVVDFATARITSGPTLTQPGQIIGTAEHLAPEQILGDPVGTAADLYAVGVLLYELLSGELPFTGRSPSALVYKQLNEQATAPSALQPAVPRSLDRLVLRLLDKLPSGRPDAATALRELDAAGQRQDLTAPASQSDADEAMVTDLRLRQFRPAFVGRQQEMTSLLTHVDTIADAGGTVFIAGEAGVGKTRLTEEVRDYARQAGIRCLTGACHFDGGLGPYMPFMDALGELFSLPGDELSPAERASLVAQLREQDSELAELATAPSTSAKIRSGFVAAMGVEDGDEGVRLRFFDAVYDLLHAAASSRPLILFFEDAHWSDAGSLELLRHLMHRVVEAPILLVVTYRPEEVHADDLGGLHNLLSGLAAAGRLQRLFVDRLDEPGLLQLAESLFPEAAFDDGFGQFLHAQSQGNPFIALEVIKLLHHRQALFCESGLWQVDPGFVEQVIPERVNALILRRIDVLSNEQRELLQLAAVIGQQFLSATLEAASGMSRIELLKLLFRLEKQHRLIRVTDGTYEFTHAKIREVLYDETPWELRREYHRSVASILQQADGDSAEEGALGHHLFNGELFGEALPYLERAAQTARRLYSWREAALLYDQIIASCRQGAGSTEQLLRALRAAGRGYANLTAYGEATARMAQMQAVAVTAQLHIEEADAVTQMGWVDLNCDRFDEAAIAFGHAIDLISDSSEDRARTIYGQALLNWGIADFECGRYAEAELRWQEARRLLHDDPAELSSCLNNLGVLAIVRGQAEEAWHLHEQVLEIDRSRGAIDQLPQTYLNMSMLRSDQERWDEALELSARGLDLCRTLRMFANEPALHLAQGEAFMGKGEFSSAERALEVALRGFRRLNDARGTADVLRQQGRLCRQQERWDDGRAILARSIEISRQFGESVSLGEALFELAELLRAVGNKDDAVVLLAEAEGIFARAEARPDLECVRHALAELQVD